MNYVGEILELVNIVKFDVRVFLNVGLVYMENFFGGLEEVVVVKGEIFWNVCFGDLCIVNVDDLFVMVVFFFVGVWVVYILI